MPGRVLSKANENKIRAAFDALKSILGLLENDPDEEAEPEQEAAEARRSLSEAANLGNWLEARLHLMFTEIADNLFGEGKVTREERISLSSAIGAALDAFNAAVLDAAPGVYVRPPWQDPPAEADMAEAAVQTEFIPLVEKAVRRDGTIPVKLIAPGWGSSGYYPGEVLERDGPQVFRKGTQMLWDHPTASEEAERPEGSLNDLAAELVSDARYADGPAGPGLYADAKVFGPYREAVDELAPHIGVSIRALGRAVQGEAEGRKGPIIQQLTAVRTVDFVTQAGAGGKVIEMFEAARLSRHAPQQEDESVDTKQLQEAVARLEQENARMKEALLLRDAREFVRQELAAATVPDVTKQRLVEQLSANPAVAEGGELDRDAYRTRIAEAVQAEAEYLAQAVPTGKVVGMGGAPPMQSGEDVSKRLADAFARLGVK